MAVLSSVHGEILRGKVGNVVGYTWKHKTCYRSYRQHINYPNTHSQQQERNWFVSMVRFASHAKYALQKGMHQKADESGMTEGNYFVAQNKSHFVRNGDSVEVMYERLTIAEGDAADVYFHKPVFDIEGRLSVEFDKNTLFSRASNDDSIYLYVYAPTRGEGIMSSAAKRRGKRVNIMLPDEWEGIVVHVYGFVIDKKGRASRSTYIGSGTVGSDETRGNNIVLDREWDNFVNVVECLNTESTTPTEPSSPSPGAVNLFTDMEEVP